MVKNEKIEEIRRQNNVVDVIKEEGVKLKGGGKTYQGICPFHEEKHPSFTVYPDTQTFHCFGCGSHGDIFDFIEKIRGVDFMEAVKILALRVGIALPSETSKEIENDLEKERAREKLLEATVEFYRGKIDTEPEVKDYLIKLRGLNEETVRSYRIGYAPASNDGLLKEHLIKQGWNEEQLKETGLLTGSGTDYFSSGYIIFPNIRYGKVVNLQGRVFPKENSKPKYLNQPGKVEHILGEDILSGSEEVIMVEGYMDWLTLRQSGFKNVLGIYGVGAFKTEWVEKFKNTEKIFIALDGDEVGRKKGEEIAKYFGSRARIVSFPVIDKEIKDWNELFVKQFNQEREGFHKEVEKSIKIAKHPFELEIERIKNLPTSDQGLPMQSLLTKIIELSQAEQSIWKLEISKKLKVGMRELNEIIKEIKEKDKKSIETEPPKPEMNQEERESAINLLKDPQILDKFLETIEKEGIIEEKENLKLIYLTFTSRLMTDPIALIVKGESSAGKSFISSKVAKYFPKEEVKIITRLTQNALYYLEAAKLKNKALVVQERVGAEEGDYSIRIMQSEGSLTIYYPTRNEKTGKMETEEHTVEGPVAYLETTTKARLPEENENRCFITTIDETPEQTRKILKRQAEGAVTGFISQEVENTKKNFRNAQQLLKSYKIIVPYAPFILSEKFYTNQLRARRDFSRLLSLIKTSTLLHQKQREQDKDRRLIAELQDYEIAYSLAPKIFQEAVKGISKKALELLEACGDLHTQDEGGINPNFKVKDAEEKIGWSRPTVNKYLKELQDYGYMEIKEGEKSKAKHYEIIKTEKENNYFSGDLGNKEIEFLPTPEELKKKMMGEERQKP